MGRAQMCVLDGKQFCSLEEGGRQHCDEEVETCVMAFNQQVCAVCAVCCVR